MKVQGCLKLHGFTRAFTLRIEILSVIAYADASKANQPVNPIHQSNQSIMHIINHPPDQSVTHSFIRSIGQFITEPLIDLFQVIPIDSDSSKIAVPSRVLFLI